MSVRPADLAATLPQRQSRIRERERNRAEDLRARLPEPIRKLRAEGRIEAAWLIGSLAWGGFGERSDIDVVVRGVNPDQTETVRIQLADALAVGDRVDLLCIEGLAPAFRDRVLAQGLRLDEP